MLPRGALFFLAHTSVVDDSGNYVGIGVGAGLLPGTCPGGAERRFVQSRHRLWLPPVSVGATSTVARRIIPRTAGHLGPL